jgi:prepilin peptidase CpaA
VNLAWFAPQWLALLFAILLVAAAVEDAVRLRISNITVGLVLLGAIVTAFVLGIEPRMWQNLALLVAALLVGTPLFGRGILGGGDVKLLAATFAWFNLSAAPTVLMAVALSGGVLALLVIALRSFNWSDKTRQRAVVLQRRGGIPYGVAIAAGALITMALQR